MDPDKFKNKKSKIAGTTGVDILKIEYLDKNYRIKLLPNTPAGKSGLVKVAELTSDISQMPMFIFRWDENDSTLDIDMYKDGKIRRDSEWIHGTSGYKGHHTAKLDGDKKLFKIDISIPRGKIFEGVLNIGLLIKRLMGVRVQSKATVGIRIFRAKDGETQGSQQ